MSFPIEFMMIHLKWPKITRNGTKLKFWVTILILVWSCNLKNLLVRMKEDSELDIELGWNPI